MKTIKKNFAKLLLLSGSTLIFSWSAFAGKTHLTMGMVLEPPHLDPTAGAAAAIDEVVYANVFEGLTRINQNAEVLPALAESWVISKDGLTYTFKLRKGVRFHDGSRFDSSDVIFSLDRARSEKSTNAQKALFAAIAEVKTQGSNTVIVRLKTPTGNFLFNMGWGDAVIVDPASANSNKSNPIGTGPFNFKRWVKGDRIELGQNGKYWGKKPALKTATFKIIPDPAAAVAALMAGDVDAFANFPAPEMASQFQSDPRFTVKVGSTEGETILSTNNLKKPFDDLRVRQAIAHAINSQEIIDGAMFGFGTPIGSHFAPHHAAYIDLTGTYPHDTNKAKKLLAESGFPNGFNATIKLPPPSYARRGGEIVASQLRKVGIKLEIIPVEWAQWLDQVFKNKNFDLTIVSHTEPMDIGIYTRPKYYFQYQNSGFNSVIEDLNVTSDPKKRYALMGAAQAILAKDAVNGFLFQLAKLGIWNKNLLGLWENSPVQANDLTGVSWKN